MRCYSVVVITRDFDPSSNSRNPGSNPGSTCWMRLPSFLSRGLLTRESSSITEETQDKESRCARSQLPRGESNLIRIKNHDSIEKDKQMRKMSGQTGSGDNERENCQGRKLI